MKKLLLTLPALLLLTQCSPTPETTVQVIVPEAELTPPEPYAELTAQLEPGGVSYSIMDGTYEWEQIRPTVYFISGIFKTAATQGGSDLPSPRVIEQLEKLPLKLGLHEIYARGSSTVKLESGGYRSKSVIQMRENAQGWMWKLTGTPADLADLTRKMPASSVLLAHTAFNLPVLHQELQKELTAFPQVALSLNQGLAEVRASGFPLDALMESVNQGFTLALTQNPEATWVLPMPPTPLSIPETGLVAMISDPDQQIMNYLLEQIKKNIPIPVSEITLQEQTVHMLPVPAPVSTAVSLNLSNVDGKTMITTSQPLMEELLQRRDGEMNSPLNELLLNIENTACTSGLIISPELENQISKIMGQSMQATQGTGADELMKPMLDFYSNVFNSIPQVSLIRKEGNFISMELLHRSPLLPQYSGNTAAMSVPMVGLMAAIALPSFQKARTTAQDKACTNNMRIIQSAKDQWEIEKNKADGAMVQESDLLDYFKGQQMPECPKGGRYQLHPIGQSPACSVHGELAW